MKWFYSNFIGVIKVFFYMIPIMLIYLLGRYEDKIVRKHIGIAGEKHVKKELDKLETNEYKVINDYMFQTKDGKTHQIDHIVVSKYGIFVIETKQYNGKITGSDYDKKICINANFHKYWVLNPVHQNYGHIQALKEVLDIDKNKMFSIVCISSKAKVEVDSKIIIKLYQLLGIIESKKQVIIDNPSEAYEKLCDNWIKSRTIKKKHVENAKQKKKENDNNTIGKCPRCGNILVKRSGQYGDFYGCSNYPRCKYTKNNIYNIKY